jgi:hypothetical protein
MNTKEQTKKIVNNLFLLYEHIKLHTHHNAQHKN